VLVQGERRGLASNASGKFAAGASYDAAAAESQYSASPLPLNTRSTVVVLDSLEDFGVPLTRTARLLIIELVLRDGNAPGFGGADMVMLTLTGGAGRTAREFESLLAGAGLTMTRGFPTSQPQLSQSGHDCASCSKMSASILTLTLK